MKSILAYLLTAILAFQAQAQITQSPNSEEQLKIIEESKCLAKENLVFDDIADFYMNDKFELAETNPKLKCFPACLMEFIKILDGCSVVFYEKFNINAFASVEKKKKFINLVESCKSVVKGTDRCECGYQFDKCMTEKYKNKH